MTLKELNSLVTAKKKYAEIVTALNDKYEMCLCGSHSVLDIQIFNVDDVEKLAKLTKSELLSRETMLKEHPFEYHFSYRGCYIFALSKKPIQKAEN